MCSIKRQIKYIQSYSKIEVKNLAKPPENEFVDLSKHKRLWVSRVQVDLLSELYGHINIYFEINKSGFIRIFNFWFYYNFSLDDDTNEIENIAGILEEINYESTRLNRSLDIFDPKKRQTQYIISFTDILLEKRENNYTRIGIMRPVIKASASIKKESAYISKIVNNNLEYICKRNDDFVYHLSNENFNKTLNLIEEINEDMIDDFTTITSEIKGLAIHRETENANNLTKLIDTFGSIYAHISPISSSDAKTFKRQLIGVVNALRIILPNKNAKQFFENIEIHDFAQKLLLFNCFNCKILAIPNEIIDQLGELKTHLNNSKLFYEFVADLYKKLSEYKIQRHKSKYDGSRLMNLVINTDSIEIKVNDLDIKSTIDSIDSDLYSRIEHLVINAVKLKQLQSVWGQTKLPTSVEFSGGRAIAKGYNVMLRDVFVAALKGSSPSIEVFALKKVIDDIHSNWFISVSIELIYYTHSVWYLYKNLKSVLHMFISI